MRVAHVSPVTLLYPKIIPFPLFCPSVLSLLVSASDLPCEAVALTQQVSFFGVTPD
jgi:hypothetical protein